MKSSFNPEESQGLNMYTDRDLHCGQSYLPSRLKDPLRNKNLVKDE